MAQRVSPLPISVLRQDISSESLSPSRNFRAALLSYASGVLGREYPERLVQIASTPKAKDAVDAYYTFGMTDRLKGQNQGVSPEAVIVRGVTRFADTIAHHDDDVANAYTRVAETIIKRYENLHNIMP